MYLNCFAMKSAKSKGIEIKANLQEEMPYAPMDEEGIHTCMANLVSNAIDACEISDKPNRNIAIHIKRARRQSIL